LDIDGWNERYRGGTRPREDFDAAPVPLLVKTAQNTRPGKALDLACGTGRNALWLAKHGWQVTAVDGSEAAIGILRERAEQSGLEIECRIADLEKHEFALQSESWDLIAICYYLQLDLLDAAMTALKPGGTIIVIVHVTEPGEEPTKHRLRPTELIRRFDRWPIQHSFEGAPHDAAHKRAVAEVVARRPDGIL
jgi:SAM-dependent methyltransferase